MLIIMKNTIVLLQSKKRDEELKKFRIVEEKEHYFKITLA
tara:strand:- start:1661 stop:1780 length:120 start_codon:yes stop_codon:yes gene_type:complete